MSFVIALKLLVKPAVVGLSLCAIASLPDTILEPLSDPFLYFDAAYQTLVNGDRTSVTESEQPPPVPDIVRAISSPLPPSRPSSPLFLPTVTIHNRPHNSSSDSSSPPVITLRISDIETARMHAFRKQLEEETQQMLRLPGESSYDEYLDYIGTDPEVVAVRLPEIATSVAETPRSGFSSIGTYASGMISGSMLWNQVHLPNMEEIAKWKPEPYIIYRYAQSEPDTAPLNPPTPPAGSAFSDGVRYADVVRATQLVDDAESVGGLSHLSSVESGVSEIVYQSMDIYQRHLLEIQRLEHDQLRQQELLERERAERARREEANRQWSFDTNRKINNHIARIEADLAEDEAPSTWHHHLLEKRLSAIAYHLLAQPRNLTTFYAAPGGLALLLLLVLVVVPLI
ncbi:hypothetical protein HK097_001664 [Rhizophlyctis rosea]|uniref:Uncharacterized protein n=1 Tax=Rhizophlyctis rosea TaxID=64517 RepID=A0AAD5WY80_9FUNG|nr:hypothetical protein HK097_001664 [Rhizophlyctis rosea]